MNDALRQRIIEAMPEIETIIANEDRCIGTGGECCDVRPAVVRCIQKIATLETMPPARVLKVLNRVAKNAKGLGSSLQALPRSVQLQLGVDKNTLAWLSGLVSAVPKLTSPPKVKQGKPNARRRQLSASLACNLLLDVGRNMPTLYPNGPYITLAALLYKTATGRKGDLRTDCAEHFKSLKKADDGNGLDLSARHLRSLRPTSPMPADLLPLVKRTRAAYKAHKPEVLQRVRRVIRHHLGLDAERHLPAFPRVRRPKGLLAGFRNRRVDHQSTRPPFERRRRTNRGGGITHATNERPRWGQSQNLGWGARQQRESSKAGPNARARRRSESLISGGKGSVKIYIAALSSVVGQTAHMAVIGIANPKSVLESYHYMNEAKTADIRDQKRKIFLDSGAYSMHTQDVRIDLKDYARFIYKNRDIIETASNLDAIGAGKEQLSYDNQKRLESWLKPEGLTILPVHHVRDHDRWLQRYIDEGYDHICLGGMVSETTQHLREWLDHVWHNYLTNAVGAPKVKVHGFGLTRLELMFRYPWYSVNSTSWIMIGQFGGVMLDMPNGDFKIDFSSRSKTQQDINSWHYKSLTDPHREAIDTRLAELEATRIKEPWLEQQWEDLLGYKPGYNPIALTESYGWRGHFNIHYFDRIQERRVDIFKRKQGTLFT